MDYKFKVTQDKIDEVLEHIVEDLGIIVFDNTYKTKHYINAFELFFSKNKGLYRLGWWDDLNMERDAYIYSQSTEITQEQFLKMSFEDLERGNIPKLYDNLKIVNIESREQFDLLKDILSREYSTVQIECYYEGIEHFSNIHIFTEASGSISHCDNDCKDCLSIEKEDCESRTVVTAREFIQKNIEKEKNTDAFYDPNYTQEELKKGDEVFIRCKVTAAWEPGSVSFTSKSHDNKHHFIGVFKADQLHKSIPQEKEINEKADLETIENVKEHMRQKKALEVLENVIQTAKDIAHHFNKTESKKHSSSIMMGSIDLSEEIKDEEILKNRERSE